MHKDKGNLRSVLLRGIDRTLSLSYWQLLGWLCLVFVAVMVLFGVLLFVISKATGTTDTGGTDIVSIIFLLLTDPGNLSSVLDGNISPGMWIFYSLVAVVGAVVFSGLLISLLSNTVQRRVDNFLSGNITYRLSNHLIVIGYDAMVPQLVKQLATTYPTSDVLLLTRKNTEEVREVMQTLLTDDELKRLVLYSGQRDSMSDLEKLNATEAAEIFIIGNRDSQDHDALNIDCLSKLVTLLKRQNDDIPFDEKIIINVLLESHTTHAMLQTTNLAQNWCQWARVIPFSFYENWARKVLTSPEYPHLKASGDETANVVIFGMSYMGLTLATEAAHRLHFPNLPDGATRHTRITFVSPNADQEMQAFRTRYRQVFELQSATYRDFKKGRGEAVTLPPTYFSGEQAEILDIDFEFIRGNGLDERIHQLLQQRLDGGNCRMAIFVCTGSDDTDMNIGLFLPDSIQQRADVCIRQKHTGKLLDWLRQLNQQTQGRYARIFPFGMLKGNFDLSHQTQRMGILINYFYNCAWQKPDTFRADHRLTAEEWREAQQIWNDQTSVANQWSSFYCCLGFLQKMEQWGVSELCEENIPEIERIINENTETLSCIEHNRWTMEKLLMGFRKPTKEEQQQIDECRQTEKKQDRVFRLMKNERYVHDYIRSFPDLLNVSWPGMRPQDNIQKIDEDMLRQIPWIIRNCQQ